MVILDHGVYKVDNASSMANLLPGRLNAKNSDIFRSWMVYLVFV